MQKGSFSVRALIATLLDVHSSGSRGSSLQSLQKEEITSFQVVCFPYGIFVGFVNFVLLCFLLLIGFKFCSHFTFHTLLHNIYPSFRKILDPLRQHWVWDNLSVWEWQQIITTAQTVNPTRVNVLLLYRLILPLTTGRWFQWIVYKK